MIDLQLSAFAARSYALGASLLLSLALAPLACSSTDTPASNGGGGGQTGSIPADACPDPVFDPANKLVKCSNGRYHREQSLACTYTASPDGEGGASASSEAEGGAAGVPDVGSSCMSDADCAGLPYGYCYRNAPVWTCKVGCAKDNDCGSGSICDCDGLHPGLCVPASCTTDADCGPSSLCAFVGTSCGGAFACTAPEDRCITSADCEPPSNGSHSYCGMKDGHRECLTTPYFCD